MHREPPLGASNVRDSRPHLHPRHPLPSALPPRPGALPLLLRGLRAPRPTRRDRAGSPEGRARAPPQEANSMRRGAREPYSACGSAGPAQKRSPGARSAGPLPAWDPRPAPSPRLGLGPKGHRPLLRPLPLGRQPQRPPARACVFAPTLSNETRGLFRRLTGLPAPNPGSLQPPPHPRHPGGPGPFFAEPVSPSLRGGAYTQGPPLGPDKTGRLCLAGER